MERSRSNRMSRKGRTAGAPALIPAATTVASAAAIAQRAYEIFLERGGTHGLADWLQAERELRAIPSSASDRIDEPVTS